MIFQYTQEELIFIDVIKKIEKYDIKKEIEQEFYKLYGLTEGQMDSIKEVICSSIFFDDWSYNEADEYDRNLRLGYDYNGENESYIYFHKESFNNFHINTKKFFDNVNNAHGEFLSLDYYTIHDDSKKDNKEDNIIYINKQMYDFYKILII